MLQNKNWFASFLAIALSTFTTQACAAVQPSNAESQNREASDPGTDEIMIRFKEPFPSQSPAITKGPMLQAIAARYRLIITFCETRNNDVQMWQLNKKISHADAERFSKEIQASSLLVDYASPNYRLLKIDRIKTISAPN
ncbi:hypothetical protein FNU76_13050 [Chitinimonas arctica]|uniref:Toxin co-regulated pilus biosynthesis protein Q C-terminal domain-containing protein n=1 Tax=Chitinimonas arctica TaxID=2594795 RepID=A0A516SGC5_9NEIS|nr:hypothetical protein [Chitinimonas arctica]QDQ27214.1 hypothetical protein FNU76_13050 [Chitinimonas arctica]